MISAANKKKRLIWARNHQNWTADDFSKVMWSDKTPVHLVQNSQRRFVRFFSSEIRSPGMKRPMFQQGRGHIMVWGAFCSDSVGPLVEIEGILKCEDYKNLLEQKLNVQEMIAEDIILQQDNAPIHKCRLVTN